ncbi:ubiquitin carboxyl-terminal hydrolase 15-like [Branchiostoma floridae]|uniref:ubiquitinyl hydrolase 1 n=1 Tax=Branchiostoma floridae TaxID=7739 RepID=A0A9J7LJD2_BRAFL|nr:ubiquitin carboxyl-terminal hydrolase 15-like [Branchiostoma floridae]
MKKELKKGDIWFLVAMKWWKQWKKYVGYDSRDMEGIGNPAYHPGPIDNSALFKDPGHPDACFLKEHLIDQLDYWLLPVEVSPTLVSWYGIKDCHVIPRENFLVTTYQHFYLHFSLAPLIQVVEFGMFVKHCKVEVYLMELKLYRHPNMDDGVTQQFSKHDTIGQIEEDMRILFNIPKDRCVRLWSKYLSNKYELLNKPEMTVQEAGLYQGQTIEIEEQNPDGSWPRGLLKTK